MQHEQQRQALRQHTPSSMTLEVQIRQPQRDCPLYIWDRERACLRFQGTYHAEPGLPADIATLTLAEHEEIPVFVIHEQSLSPQALVTVRLLGALHLLSEISQSTRGETHPLEGTFLITCVEDENETSPTHTSVVLLPEKVAALRFYIEKHTPSIPTNSHAVIYWDAQLTEQKIRETRLFLKRRQREQASKTSSWRSSGSSERPVAWRAVEGPPASIRRQLEQDHSLLTGSLDPQAPYAQAEHLIRFVPTRFQDALSHLLLEDERLLAFIERPLLRQRSGWLGRQERLAHEGLFLITDRQALWLSDYFSSRNDTTLRGYHARSLPLERLTGVVALTNIHSAPSWMTRHLPQDHVHQHLALALNSTTGREIYTIAFPVAADLERALQRIAEIMHAFLPLPADTTDRRVRRVAQVDAYIPRADEAAALDNLGGLIPPASRHLLEQALATQVGITPEQRLASVLVPALEEYQSPHRLIVLTPQEVLVLDERRAARSSIQVQHYPLHQLSSAQISYSLLGSNLTLFRPRGTNEPERIVIPFQSPAATMFLPLFTRLRLLINSPALEQSAQVSEKVEAH